MLPYSAEGNLHTAGLWALAWLGPYSACLVSRLLRRDCVPPGAENSGTVPWACSDPGMVGPCCRVPEQVLLYTEGLLEDSPLVAVGRKGCSHVLDHLAEGSRPDLRH